MRNFRVFGVLCAVGIFSVVMVSSVSAAEWLLNGATIVSPVPVETPGEVTLDVLVLGALAVDIRCSLIFDGTVGPGATDLVEKILNLAKEEIGKELVGLGLSCEVITSAFEECGPVDGLAEVWTDSLPWMTTLELEGTTVLERLTE